MGKCGCNNNSCCNKCKPVCDPCNKQPKILYCGRPVECLDIKRGDKLDDIIKTAGDKICQLTSNYESLTYVNIENASLDQCEYGGYVIQVLSISTDSLIEEAIICNSTPLTFQENGVYVSQPTTVNFADGYGVEVTATHDVLSNTTTYEFSYSLSPDITITWQEGIDLMDNSEVQPNILYYVSDRGWYLQGINDNSFSINGYKREKIVKETYYSSSGNVKGVWGLSSGPYVVNDLVVYGGKIWKNNTGSIGASTDLFTLDANWTIDITPTYYEDKIIKIHVDYRDNWVFRQEDTKNNIISIPKTVYGTYGLDRVWMDWNQPGIYNNDTSIILNNAPNKSIVISNNRGIGRITDNFSSTITGNILKTPDGISKNFYTNIIGNIVNDVTLNTGVFFTDNILEDTYSNNTIGSFIGNKSEQIITNNTLPHIRFSTFNGPLTNNINMTGNANAGISNSVFGSGNTFNNSLSGNGIEYVYCKDFIANNTDFSISRSNVKEVSINNTLIVVESDVINQITGNDNGVVINVKTRSIVSNTDFSLSTTEATDILGNDTVSVSNCKVFSTISSNTNITNIENNVCYSIIDNENIHFISNNRINGEIRSNITSSVPSTGVDIIGNMNNGSIFYNTIDDNVVINYNNNNGNIGTNAIPTIRSTSILGTVVNL